MCQQFQETMEQLYDDVVRPAYTGLGASTNSWVVEAGNKSGLPHSHGLAYRREEDPGPGSLSSLLGRLQGGKGDLTWEERGRVADLGKGAITVTMSARDLADQFPTLTEQEVVTVVTLARRVQQHYCSQYCSTTKQNGQKCGQYFPRPPSLLPLVAMRPDLVTEEQKNQLEALETIGQRVQDLLRGLPRPFQPDEEDPALSLLLLLQEVADPPVLLPGGGYSWAGAMFPPSEDLVHLQQECEALTTTQEARDLLVVYHSSLLFRQHAKYLPRRRVGECWGVNYNPWLLKEAKSNLEVEIVTHTPKSLFHYLCKGATQQTLLMTADEVESRGGRRMGDMADQLRQMEDESWREVSLTEAFYLLDRDLHLFTSNSPVVYVSMRPFSSIVAQYILR